MTAQNIDSEKLIPVIVTEDFKSDSRMDVLGVSGVTRGPMCYNTVTSVVVFCIVSFAILVCCYEQIRDLSQLIIQRLLTNSWEESVTDIVEVLVYGVIYAPMAVGGLGVIWVIFETIMPYIGGYCYTCAFKYGHRCIAASRYGTTPYWEEVSSDIFVNKRGKYNVVFAEMVHLTVDEDGFEFDQLETMLTDCRVGQVRIPRFEAVLWVQRIIRALLVAVAAVNHEPKVLLISGVVYMVCAITDAGTVLNVLGLMIIFFNVDVKISIAVACGMWLLETVLVTVAIPSWNESKIKSNAIPGTANYPEGLEPMGVSRTYVGGSENTSITDKEFVSPEFDGSTTDVWVEQTGLVHGKVNASPNPHKESRAATNFLTFQEVQSYEMNRTHVLNVGGTFRGWPPGTTGVTMCPELGGQDARANIDCAGRPGRGQEAHKDYVATNTTPVGEDGPRYNPGVEYKGISGAKVFMVQCYEVPIKALLGLAYRNNSAEVNVIMHGEPSFLTHESGILPFSRQSWEHDRRKGTIRYKWLGTNGQDYEHSYRIWYEHFFTDYIQVAEGVYYVGEIYRSVFDIYQIKWTRQYTKPDRRVSRNMSLRCRHGSLMIPMIHNHSPWAYTVTRADLNVYFGEYVMTSKNPEGLAVSLRATTTNTVRNRNEVIDYPTPNQVVSLHNANNMLNQLDRYFDVKTVSAWDTIKKVLGLGPDSAAMLNIADGNRQFLRRQRVTNLSAETLFQDFPYMDVVEKPAPVDYRVIPMPSLKVESGTLSQDIMDTIRVSGVTLLTADGGSMAAKLCNAVFGRHKNIPHVIPIGDPESGGSVFTNQNCNLLAIEIDYLIETGFIFLVKPEEEAKYKVYGGSKGRDRNNDITREAIVILHMKEEKVFRVHYPAHTRVLSVLSNFEKIPADLADDGGWVDKIHDTKIKSKRTYAENTNFAQELVVGFENKYNSTPQKGNTVLTIDEAKERYKLVQNPDKYKLVLPGKGGVSQIPSLPQPHPIKIYDRTHHVSKIITLPGHHYHKMSVEEFRNYYLKNA